MVLETRSVVDALRTEMQRQILRGAIPPGMGLGEVSVAHTFDVARPTAKAAIEQLVNVGLLRRSRNKMARVPLLDTADVVDLYLSRGVVECAAVRILAERRDVPSAAARAVERFRAVIARRDALSDLVECDVEFHRALVGASQSPRLFRLHEAVMGEAHLCMSQVQVHHLLHPQVIAEEHKRILAMIKSGNADGAVGEIDAHLANARNRLVTYLKDAKTTTPELS